MVINGHCITDTGTDFILVNACIQEALLVCETDNVSFFEKKLQL